VDQARGSTKASPTSQLAEGLRARSPASFESFYELYFGPIYGFVRRRAQNAAEAEDLTQEIFLAVTRSIDSYQERADFESWVFGVARNVVREHLRSTQRRRARETLAQRGGAPPTPEQKLLRHRIVETLARRLAEVEPWQAEAFVLHYVDGLPLAEIVRRTERSRSTVDRGLARLRRRIAIDLELSEAAS
jgi:RNA polymerase sigma-70 factor (ECF subfamily)